jgi:hypothetical protein
MFNSTSSIYIVCINMTSPLYSRRMGWNFCCRYRNFLLVTTLYCQDYSD